MKAETFATHPAVKVGLYLLVLVFFEFANEAAKLDNSEVAAMTWWDWLKFLVTILAPAMLILRAYTDQSLQRYIDKTSLPTNRIP